MYGVFVKKGGLSQIGVHSLIKSLYYALSDNMKNSEQ